MRDVFRIVMDNAIETLIISSIMDKRAKKPELLCESVIFDTLNSVPYIHIKM